METEGRQEENGGSLFSPARVSRSFVFYAATVYRSGEAIVSERDYVRLGRI